MRKLTGTESRCINVTKTDHSKNRGCDYFLWDQKQKQKTKNPRPDSNFPDNLGSLLTRHNFFHVTEKLSKGLAFTD